MVILRACKSYYKWPLTQKHIKQSNIFGSGKWKSSHWSKKHLNEGLMSLLIHKLANSSPGQPKGSFFNSYYTKV